MKTTSEQLFVIKNGHLFSAEQGALVPVETPPAAGERYAVLLDDRLFFYHSMQAPAVGRKKLRTIAQNYLSVIFGGELIEGFDVIPHSGHALLPLFSPELPAVIGEHKELLAKARTVSTPLIELWLSHPDFTYTDGERTYTNAAHTLARADAENASTYREVLEGMTMPKGRLTLPGIEREKTPYARLIPFAVAFAACYLLFIGGETLRLMAEHKALGAAEAQLAELYAKAGVGSSNDPYGLLLSKAGRSGGAAGKVMMMEVLANISSAAPQDVTLTALTAKGASVRIEGSATDFATIETFHKTLQSVTKKTVTLEDTKKQDNDVKFVMRYEQ